MDLQTYESLDRIHRLDTGRRGRRGAGPAQLLRRLAARVNKVNHRKVRTYEPDNSIPWLDGIPPLPGEGLARLLHSFRARVNALVIEPVRGEIHARQAIRQLQELDDQLLADIGLERWQIETFVRYRARRGAGTAIMVDDRG